MRIVHLAIELAEPSGGSGGAVRQYHLLKGLAALGHDVTVISPVTAAQHEVLHPVELFAQDGLKLIPAPRAASREREAIHAVARNPKLLLRVPRTPFYGMQTEMIARSMRPIVERELAASPDVVTVDHDVAAALGELGPLGVPRVLTFHNDTPTYYKVRADQADSRLREAAFRREARVARNYIDGLLDRFATLVAVSDDDARLISSRTGRDVEVIPNGSDALGAVPAAETAGDAPCILFTGTMNHPPNGEGILWFHREVWPQIISARPDARLLIVGRNPQERILALGGEAGVEVTGEVPSMDPYYAQATVTIAPLKSGSGTRLKIMDALAAQRIVVTTTIGCEGIDVVHDETALIADEPDAFASEVLRAFDDNDFRQGIAAAGRRLVVDRYDWQSLAGEFAVILERTSSPQGL